MDVQAPTRSQVELEREVARQLANLGRMFDKHEAIVLGSFNAIVTLARQLQSIGFDGIDPAVLESPMRHRRRWQRRVMRRTETVESVMQRVDVSGYQETGAPVRRPPRFRHAAEIDGPVSLDWALMATGASLVRADRTRRRVYADRVFVRSAYDRARREQPGVVSDDDERIVRFEHVDRELRNQIYGALHNHDYLLRHESQRLVRMMRDLGREGEATAAIALGKAFAEQRAARDRTLGRGR